MNSIKASIKGKKVPQYAPSILQLAIESELNKLFYKPKVHGEERKGLHASAIIVPPSQFCLREQVLSVLFKRNKEESKDISNYLIRIFEEGNSVHEKWQNLFVNAGIAKAIEGRGYSSFYDLYMTPDAIIEMFGKQWIVEIKSANTNSFKKMVTKHGSGNNQMQLYMYFFNIPRGFVLVEDKNDQNIKIFPEIFDYKVAYPYIKRLSDIKNGKEKFISDDVLPCMLCGDLTESRAKKCPMSDSCFGIEREKL